MKKGLLLLTSLIVTTTAVTPMLQQQNSNLKVESGKSLDIVDLTAIHSHAVRITVPNLIDLLNNSVTPGEYPLNDSWLILTAPDGSTIKSNSAFDKASLRSLLGRQQAHIKDAQLQFSSQIFNNVVMVSYSYWEPSENREKETSIVIDRFSWPDNADRFWTKDVKFEFQLVF